MLAPEHLSFEARLGNKNRRQQLCFAASAIRHHLFSVPQPPKWTRWYSCISERMEQALPTTVQSSYDLGEKHGHPWQITQEGFSHTMQQSRASSSPPGSACFKPHLDLGIWQSPPSTWDGNNLLRANSLLQKGDISASQREPMAEAGQELYRVWPQEKGIRFKGGHDFQNWKYN